MTSGIVAIIVLVVGCVTHVVTGMEPIYPGNQVSDEVGKLLLGLPDQPGRFISLP